MNDISHIAKTRVRPAAGRCWNKPLDPISLAPEELVKRRSPRSSVARPPGVPPNRNPGKGASTAHEPEPTYRLESLATRMDTGSSQAWQAYAWILDRTFRANPPNISLLLMGSVPVLDQSSAFGRV
jgi:hypothetical protein